MKSKGRSVALTVVLGGAWLVALWIGNRALLAYAYTPGPAAMAPMRWPAGSTIAGPKGLPMILVMAHPKCPCTRATIEELATLMAQLHARATATVVFVHPEGMQKDWEKTDLWRSAERIPGVSVSSDPDGVEASRFGALASGQTMLFNGKGELQFSGGITPFRGHAGDNAGSTAIASLVMTGISATNHTSVYGCSLKSPERAVTP